MGVKTFLVERNIIYYFVQFDSILEADCNQLVEYIKLFIIEHVFHEWYNSTAICSFTFFTFRFTERSLLKSTRKVVSTKTICQLAN